ncbi:MAG: hypothetical protein AAB966_00125, partial [Patescibacteria group bacterium]
PHPRRATQSAPPNYLKKYSVSEKFEPISKKISDRFAPARPPSAPPLGSARTFAEGESKRTRKFFLAPYELSFKSD